LIGYSILHVFGSEQPRERSAEHLICAAIEKMSGGGTPPPDPSIRIQENERILLRLFREQRRNPSTDVV
jgi:hypothetical protein